MRFRKLRIAWSVFWGLIAMLLIVLWVRSYWWKDVLVWVQGSARNVFSVGTLEGTIEFAFVPSGDAEEQLLPAFCRVQRRVIRHVAISSFAWSSSAPLTLLRFPIWVLIASVAAIGMASWVRLFNSFSLRTLLIATTLVAVFPLLIVQASR
jgi:hypothetical protein